MKNPLPLTEQQTREAIAAFRLARAREKIDAELRANERRGNELLEQRLREREQSPVFEI